MKTKPCLTAFAIACLVSTGCYQRAQRQAHDLAAQISATMAATQIAEQSSNPPANSAQVALLAIVRDDTMPENCYLRATVNGKRWEATAMTPDLDRSSILEINGRKQSGFINFTIGGRNIKTGKPRKFTEQHPVLFYENHESYLATSGEWVVNKVDEHFVEGTFSFTVNDKGKSFVCTNGEFRVPSPPRAL